MRNGSPRTAESRRSAPSKSSPAAAVRGRPPQTPYDRRDLETPRPRAGSRTCKRGDRGRRFLRGERKSARRASAERRDQDVERVEIGHGGHCHALASPAAAAGWSSAEYLHPTPFERHVDRDRHADRGQRRGCARDRVERRRGQSERGLLVASTPRCPASPGRRTSQFSRLQNPSSLKSPCEAGLKPSDGPNPKDRI